jgi:hypothetical protein
MLTITNPGPKKLETLCIPFKGIKVEFQKSEKEATS